MSNTSNTLTLKALYENQVNSINNRIDEIECRLKEARINLKYELKNCEIICQTTQQFTEEEWEYLHKIYIKINKCVNAIKNIENEINKMIKE